MKILNISTWYELFGLNCKKGNIYGVALGCISHASDSFGFGAWQVQCYVPLNSYFTILPLSNKLYLPFAFQDNFSHF